jgi:hypothetical protein
MFKCRATLIFLRTVLMHVFNLIQIFHVNMTYSFHFRPDPWCTRTEAPGGYLRSAGITAGIKWVLALPTDRYAGAAVLSFSFLYLSIVFILVFAIMFMCRLDFFETRCKNEFRKTNRKMKIELCKFYLNKMDYG